LGQGAIMKLSLRHSVVPIGILSCAACATSSSRKTGAAYVQAQVVEDAPPPKPIIVPSPQPPAGMPGQMKPMPSTASTPASTKRAHAPPQQVVADANKRAAQAPDGNATFNAIVQYSYEPGTLYQVFAAPMRITDIALQPGEHIVGQPA